MSATRIPVAILGSGMAGLGAAHHLRECGRAGVIFEKKSYPGGHTMSHKRDGFVFDEGPHVSFTRDERLRGMFEQAVGRELLKINAYIDNYWMLSLLALAFLPLVLLVRKTRVIA